MHLQKKKSVFDIDWDNRVKYGEIQLQREKEFSNYNFKEANIERLVRLFEICEDEAKDLLKKGIVLPAYEYALKCSHIFNLLDSRGAISITERTNYIARVREIARRCALLYVKETEGK